MTPHAFSMVLRLVRRELRSGLKGFGVFLLCLFLGVFAISATKSFTAAARGGLLADASALLGGDLEIRVAHRVLAPQQREKIASFGELSEVAELRTMAGSRQGNRTLVELKAVAPPYPLYGALVAEPPLPAEEALATRGEHFGALVEQSLLVRLELAIGDLLQVGDALLEIRGVLRVEPDRSIRGFNLGPRLMVSVEALEATGLIQPGSLINYRYRLRLADRTQAGAVKEQLQQAFPRVGWRITTWEKANPRVRFFLDRMDTNLSLIGLCALLIGGLGIAGAVRGYLTERLPHIAAMKAMGAPRGLIFTAYLCQILLLGLLGTALGLAAGASTPFVAAKLLAGHFPIPLAPALEPAALLTAALFGLLIVLIFSLKELGAACRVETSVLFRGYIERPGSVGRAVWLAMAALTCALVALALISSEDKKMAAGFVLGASLCFMLFRLLSVVIIRLARALPRPANPRLRLALSNIHRPGSPASSVLFALGLGLTSLVCIALVQANLQDMVRKTVPKQAPTFFFLDIQPHQMEALEHTLAQSSDAAPVQRYPTLRGRIIGINNVPVEQAEIGRDVRWAVRGDRFLSYASLMPSGTKLVEGQWWDADYRGPALLSLTSDLARGFGVGIGDSLKINVLGREVTAEIANLREVDWSSLQLNFALLLSPGVLEGAPQTWIATIELPQHSEEAVYRAVTGNFPNVSTISIREVLQNVSRTMDRIGGAFSAMATLALLSGFLVLAGAVSADQHRRIQDAVIFKVCGATSRDCLLAFAFEFCLLGFFAGLVAALAGTLAALGILKGPMDVGFSLHPEVILTTLLAGISVTLLLGLTGTWKALRKKPAEFLRNQ